MPGRTSHHDADPARRALFSLLLFSSASDLVCEIAWGRALGLVFGVTVFAVSAVLAAFMPPPVGVAPAPPAPLVALPAIRILYVAASRSFGAGAWALRPVVFLLS